MRKNLKTANKVSKLIVAPLLTAALIAPTLLTVPRISLAEEAADKPLNTIFSSDYETENAVIKAEAELNLKMATEGSVLLKNKDNALPLKTNEKNITVFHSLYSNWDDNPIYGYSLDYTLISGGGSGCVVKKGSSSEQGVYKGLKNNGFNVNPTMKAVNDDYMFPMAHNKGKLNKITGPDVEFIKEKAGSSFANYDDAAVITISRQESEAADITSMMTDNPDQNGQILFDYTQEGVDHYLQLNSGERKLIKFAKENFKKVVVLLNTPCPMEVAGLEDDDEIDALMWIGFPGYNGLMAIGDLLSGKSQPSGKTVDVWTSDMSKDPTWQNFGYNVQTNGYGTDTNIWMLDKNGKKVPDSNGYGDTFYSSVDYEEGIYLGYKFYETAAEIGYFEATKPENANDMPEGVEDRYYNRTNGVTYPFGFGLSYTTFSQEIIEGSLNTGGSAVKFDVKVTNTGKTNGKEVVQVYFNPPYTEGGIEKSAANLVAFAKTEELKPGESETVSISFLKRDMASYDYNDANKDGHKGYELEAGKYVISVNADSHTVLDYVEWNSAKTENYDTDSATGNAISNKFSVENGWFNVDKSNYSQNGESVTFLTRAQVDGKNGFVETFPEAPTAEELTFNDAAIAYIKTQKNFDVSYDEEDSPWVLDAVIPEDWTQASAADIAARKISDWSEKPIADIELSDMIGIDYESEEVITSEGKLKGMTGKQAWTAFMNQLSYEEMVDYVSAGQFKTPKIMGVGNPGTSDGDGPAQFKKESMETGRYGYGFACGIVLASTWNTELAEEYGKMIGEWGLRCGATGWYGPSVNIHRSPLGGRNFEYLSEDGILAGKIAAGMVKGAASKGMITYMKHFALNSQEAERHGVCEWTNEQALREIYLKPFEIAVKEGGSTGMMCSFNRLGGIFAGTNYNLMVKLLEDEWGFRGAHVTDFYGDIRWPGNALIRCHIFPMGDYQGSEKIQGTWDETDECVKVDGERSDALWHAVRTTSLHMLYTTANSNAMGVYDNFHLNHDGIVDLHYTFYQGQVGNYRNISFHNDFQDRGEFNQSFYVFSDDFTECGGAGQDDWHTLIPGVKFHCGAGDSFVATPGETTMFTTAGHWEFTLVANLKDSSGNWYENGRAKLIFDVISAFEIAEAGKTTVAGAQYEGQVNLVEGSFLAEIVSCTDPENTLPEGLKVDETGKITGATDEVGTHKIKLLMNGTYWFEFTLEVKDGVVFRVHDGFLQVRYSVDGTWINLYAMEDLKGEQGEQGEKGETGEQGIKGEQGEKGETGEQGTQGEKGETGEQGVKGEDGKTPTIEISEDGFWVINGEKTDVKAVGTDGKDGAPGAPGADGKDGASAEGGCNGSAEITGVTIASIGLILAVVAVQHIVRRRKED